MKDCIFCKIIRDEIPSYKVYEDENTLAFLDIHPASRYHTLKDTYSQVQKTGITPRRVKSNSKIPPWGVFLFNLIRL